MCKIINTLKITSEVIPLWRWMSCISTLRGLWGDVCYKVINILLVFDYYVNIIIKKNIFVWIITVI